VWLWLAALPFEAWAVVAAVIAILGGIGIIAK
jgi:hypothetical protein